MNAIRLFTKLRLTQHKRFVPYGTHPCLRAPACRVRDADRGTHRQANFCFTKTSFMLGTTLGAIAKKDASGDEDAEKG